MINFAGLNSITFSRDKKDASIGGGALVNDIVIEAYSAGTGLAILTCTCLSFLGASLGGGLTRTMGLYGTGVDQIL